MNTAASRMEFLGEALRFMHQKGEKKPRNLAMLRASNYVGALGNVGLSLALGLTAVAIGYVLGKTGA